MWVVYKKERKQVVGLSPNGRLDLEKKTVIKEIVAGLFNASALSSYDAIQVTDQVKASTYMAAFPGSLFLTGSSRNPELEVRDKVFFYLRVESDAPDQHPVDGIPEILADGKSSTLITIHKMNNGVEQKGDDDDEQFFLRTDRGILRDVDGVQEISSISLDNGVGCFRLHSEKIKRVATIQIFCTDENMADHMLKIEFI